jgi:hypothetical protein
MQRPFASAVTFTGVLMVLGTSCSTPKPAAERPVSSTDSAIGQGPPAHGAAAPDGSPAISPIERVGQEVMPGPDAGALGGERAHLAQLEREARAIAKTTGCSSVSACRSAPVGAKACGGPRSYIVYCAASTDTVALFGKLRELETAEKAYNKKSGMMSTCEFRLPPKAALNGERCTEAPAGP